MLETLPKRGYRLNCAAPEFGDARSPVSGDTDPKLAVESPPGVSARRFSRWVPAAVAAVLVMAGAGAVLLDRLDYFWRNPIDAAVFSRLTDFEGTEQAAAVSRNGRFVAFLSDRAGVLDAWIKDLETGEFRNLIHCESRGAPVRCELRAC